jgi:hypothetical protein
MLKDVIVREKGGGAWGEQVSGTGSRDRHSAQLTTWLCALTSELLHQHSATLFTPHGLKTVARCSKGVLLHLSTTHLATQDESAQ